MGLDLDRQHCAPWPAARISKDHLNSASIQASWYDTIIDLHDPAMPVKQLMGDAKCCTGIIPAIDATRIRQRRKFKLHQNQMKHNPLRYLHHVVPLRNTPPACKRDNLGSLQRRDKTNGFFSKVGHQVMNDGARFPHETSQKPPC